MIKEKVKIPTLNAESWNTLIGKISRRLPITCVRTSKKWKHPWLVSPEWKSEDLNDPNSLKKGQWVYRIKTGFVNGVDPEISTIANLASERTLDRIEEETSERPKDKKPVTAWLTESPVIQFGASRIIGKGASAEEIVTTSDGALSLKFEAVPEFFLQFGVSPESVIFIGGINSGLQEVEQTAAQDPPPILRALDVVLSVDRLTAKLDILRGNGYLDGYNALYFITFGRSTPIKERPTLRTDAKYVQKIDVEIGDFLQEVSDDETDSIKIATIYLLSPVGTPIEAVPDGTWRPFVKHDVFWNLAHAPAELPDTVDFEPLQLITPLLAGIANPIFAGILSPINDNLSIATAFLQRPNLSGKFWTL